MNKKKIDAMLPVALQALQSPECGIVDNGKIVKTYRSAISSFGGAVVMGSFKAAVAFFGKDADSKKSKISRSKLLRTLYYISTGEWKPADEIVQTVLAADAATVTQLNKSFSHASVALKQAMNAFDLVEKLP